MNKKELKKEYRKTKYFIVLTVLVFVAVILLIVFNLSKPTKVNLPKASFNAEMLKCQLDMNGDGIFSFNFDVNVTEKTKLPSQLFFKINRIYNLEKYRILREYKLDRIYSNETIENVSFAIERIYKDYMYLPSQNFDFQVFYCEFTDLQKLYLNYTGVDLFDSLSKYCLMLYDYEDVNQGYIHVVSQNAGEQCEVIQRSTS